jgi:hypothetical protein
MCILIHHTEKTKFSQDLLEDFYSFNPDGFGLMYGDGNKIHVTKSLGTVEETIKLYEDFAKGRDCVIHYRMKTHGKIDMINCHPYEITENLWVAHNGILQASNPIFLDMSDTWHLIEYILKPIALRDENIFFNEDFQDYLASLIGSSNKLAFCHADGRTAIINRKSGVDYKNAWLSNTYAWSASKYGIGSAIGKTYYTYGADWWSGSKSSIMEPLDYNSSYVGEVTRRKFNYDKVIRAAYNSWVRGESRLLDWVIQAPEKAGFLLQEFHNFSDQEIDQLVNAYPEDAAEYLSELFQTDSVGSTVYQ